MSRKGKGMFGLLAGIGIGIGAGMLLAPKTGEELRKDLSKKLNELWEKAKEIDAKEVADEIKKKIADLRDELEDLDKEKALNLARQKGEDLKVKANDLLALAKEKGTPVLEKAAEEVRVRAIQVTKEVLKKLENAEKAESKKEKKETK